MEVNPQLPVLIRRELSRGEHERCAKDWSRSEASPSSRLQEPMDCGARYARPLWLCVQVPRHVEHDLARCLQ